MLFHINDYQHFTWFSWGWIVFALIMRWEWNFQCTVQRQIPCFHPYGKEMVCSMQIVALCWISLQSVLALLPWQYCTFFCVCWSLIALWTILLLKFSLVSNFFPSYLFFFSYFSIFLFLFILLYFSISVPQFSQILNFFKCILPFG